MKLVSVVLFLACLSHHDGVPRDRRIETHRVWQFIHFVTEWAIILEHLERLRDRLPVALVLDDIHPWHHVENLHA